MEMKCCKEVKRVLISLCMLLLVTGCRNAMTEEKNALPQEAETGNESDVFLPEKLEGKTVENCEPIDYTALLEDGHKILNKNICVNPKSVYEDDWLVEQLEELLAMDKECVEEFDMRESVIDYFLFDLNDDDVEEYIVSFSGSLWNGSAGNNIFILRKQSEGDSEKIMQVVAQVYGYEEGYWPIAILDEKVNGYYKIVFPWTGNNIWEYDTERKQYELSENINELNQLQIKS